MSKVPDPELARRDTRFMHVLARPLADRIEREELKRERDQLEAQAIGILMPSRIVLVADAYHAMISERPYRGAMSQSEALAEIERNTGSQFCPRTVDAFFEVHKEIRDCSTAR